MLFNPILPMVVAENMQIISVLIKSTMLFLAQMSEHFFKWITQNTSRIHLKMKMKGAVGR